MKRIHPLFALLVTASLTGVGCYTVLRHPATYEPGEDLGERTACADCHEDADLYHYTEAYGASWYSYYPTPWAYYYQSPWWYDDYWYYAPDSDAPGGPGISGGRHLWSRGGGGLGLLPYQGKQRIEPSQPPATPDRTGTPDGQKPDDDKKGKKKKKRHLWGR